MFAAHYVYCSLRLRETRQSFPFAYAAHSAYNACAAFLLVVRRHSPVFSFSFSFRFRFAFFFLFFVFFASLYLVFSLFFACFVSLSRCLPVLLFLLLALSLSSSLSSLLSSFSFGLLLCSSLVFVRSFVSSLYRRRILCCGLLSRMAVFFAAPSSVVFMSISSFRFSSFFFFVDFSSCNLCRP